MAEAAAVIGLVASIASLVDLSVKIVSRVRDYNAQAADIPKTFRSLADRLPLLTHTLQLIQARAQAGHIAIDVAKDLNVLVHDVLQQVKSVEQCLEHVVPALNASRFDRVLSGLKSLAKDEKVKQAVEKIHRGIDVLVLHQTTSAVEINDQIRQELSRLSLQSPPSQQLVPDSEAHQAFGLCLGQAPLIEPDAFIGRQAELQQLHGWLSKSQNAQVQRIVSIVGMGGLGKTQLSLAYAREYGHLYSSVFWLNAKDRTSLRRSMSALAALLFTDITVAATNPDEENVHVEKVRQWFSDASNDQWLLIFDNYDDPSLPNIRSPTGFDIRHFFPTRAQGSILITTRTSKLSFSKSLKLQKLQDLDTCIAVLSQRSGREIVKDQDSRQLAARLDGLPLALAITGTYLAQTNTSCADYLNLYETAWNDLHGPDAEELMEYEDRTLSSTWAISLDQIRRQDADAAELLQVFGYLNNEDIWYDLIEAGADRGPSWLGRVTVSKIRFDRAMSKLGDYSLVEVKDESYRVHPCLHDWIVEHLNASLNELLFFATVACLQSNIPESQHPHYWTMIRRLLRHISRIQQPRFTILWDNNACNKIVFDASHDFGTLHVKACELDLAEAMFMRALAGKEEALGPDHVSTLGTVHNLGTFYNDQGKPNLAEAMLMRALAGREEALGPDHTFTLDTVNNLGGLYRDQGKLDEAEVMYDRALAGYEKTLGLDHTSTLRTVHNLGTLYDDQGKPNLAEAMYDRALAGREKALGPDHTSTLETVNNLGVLYDDQGKPDLAEVMYDRALAGREKALGPDHTSTLETVNNLGSLYSNQGKLDEAEAMFERALAGYEKALGPDHTSTLRSVGHLGNLYAYQGKLDEAEAMYVRALAGYEQALGPDHTLTLRTVKNLGLLAEMRL